MSLILRTTGAVVLLLAAIAAGQAQLFTDQGLMSGSGMMIVPTTATAPVAEFSLQSARVEFLRPGERGMNVVTFVGGFSSHVEGYLRLTGEQIGMPSSMMSYSFGVKMRSPISLPVAEQHALWLESGSTEQEMQRAVYPPNVFRGGIVLAFGTNGINPVALAGVASVEGNISPLIGGGVTYAAGHDAELGAELLYGYAGSRTLHAVLDAAIRVLPHVSVHAMPGYITSPTASTWLFSIGLSFSTADIDYHPERVSNNGEFVMPSIEDVEREMQGEKKNE